MVNEPTTPISDLTPFVRHLDHCVVWKPGALRCNCGLADAFDAALASPEGVVTLDGKQWRVEGQRWSVTMGEDGVWDGEGMPPGTYVCLVPYQPEDPKHG